MTQNIYSIFSSHISDRPHQVAAIVEGHQLTYSELGHQIEALSHSFAQLGIRTGDHLGILLPNSIEYIVIMLVAAKMGLVMVPLNMSLGTSAIARAFSRAGVRHCISWHARADELRPVPEMQEAVPGHWIVLGEEVPDCHNYASLLANGQGKTMAIPVDVSAPYILTMTSGSTGDPKPIMLSQATKIARANSAVNLYGITSKDITLAATPLYHSLAERLVLIPLLTGGTAVVMAGYTTTKWLELTNQYQVSFTILVSSQVKQLLDAFKAGASVPPSLRCLVSSSERLPNPVKQELLNLLPCDFHECYGTSEIAIATNLQGSAPSQKRTSVGLPVLGARVAILRKDGQLADAGEEGEIICKTEMLFSGYYGRDDTTRQAMWGDYFRTGDLGKFDRDGYLYFLGRDKETIITGGINVYPQDIEEVLLRHGAVAECAVVPFEDARLGEVVAAVLVGNLNLPADLRALQRLCAKELADYQQPRKIFHVKQLPRNPMGKVAKRQLTEDIKSLTPVWSQ